jgi:AmmeMemoRadiSam system protein B
MVRGMLEHAGPREAPDEPVPRALIVPHAGFVYSGPVAASAYRLIRPAAGRIRKVVLLGPSHRVPFRGLAVPESDALATPLGEVPVDQALKAKATKLAVVDEADLAHAREHCLEVQLPFLQALLPDFSVLPVVVGECTDRAVLELLESLPLEEPDTLLVVSSDLSHYHDYATARGMDSETVDATACPPAWWTCAVPGTRQGTAGRSWVTPLWLSTRGCSPGPSLSAAGP